MPFDNTLPSVYKALFSNQIHLSLEQELPTLKEKKASELLQ